MASIKAIKTRLKSVKATQKITSAMKLVASIKFKKLERAVEESRVPVDGMSSQLDTLVKNLDQTTRFPREVALDKSEKLKSVLMIVYSSNKGMCGGFNVNIVKQCREFVKKQNEAGVEVGCIVLGGKVYAPLSKIIKNDSIRVIDNIDDNNPIEFFKEFSKEVFDKFQSKICQKVVIVYNEFVSAVKTEVVFKYLLPLYEEVKMEKCERITEFGPDADLDWKALVKCNLLLRLYHAFLESLASEYSCRMVAMDSANKNADEMIKKLTLEYNQRRQSAITNELVEIISGAEAI